jgi:hypothetical protein
MHFSTLVYCSYFFVKLCNSYLIKCKEKMKEKIFLWLNGTEPGEKQNIFFLCNGWILSFRITVVIILK